MDADYVHAGKGYNNQSILDCIDERVARTVIRPRKNRKEQRGYNKHLYKIYHFVETAFLRLK